MTPLETATGELAKRREDVEREAVTSDALWSTLEHSGLVYDGAGMEATPRTLGDFRRAGLLGVACAAQGRLKDALDAYIAAEDAVRKLEKGHG